MADAADSGTTVYRPANSRWMPRPCKCPSSRKGRIPYPAQGEGFQHQAFAHTTSDRSQYDGCVLQGSIDDDQQQQEVQDMSLCMTPTVEIR